MADDADAGSASLAAIVRAWRERALLTQAQLARTTGLGVRTIRRLEGNGGLRPRSESMRLLADALALTEAERVRLIAAARGEELDGLPADGAPRQLPADVAGFTGRADILARLDSLIPVDPRVGNGNGNGNGHGRPPVVITAIAGMGGVGKTSVAVHWAHRVADRFPDGQLYVDLRGFHHSGSPVEPAVAVRGFLDALDVPRHRIPSDPDALTALYRSVLADKRVLVVLDNARTAPQVRPLLPAAPGCMVLVTSRNQLEGLVALEGAHLLALDVLSTVEARRLLARRLGADRVAAEPDAADELVELCARLPLALAVVAARATVHGNLTLAGLTEEVRGARGRLSALNAGDPQTSVRAVFSWSYRCLDEDVARLFRLLGLHPGPTIGVAAAASLAGLPVERVRPLLEDLARVHLVLRRGPARYALHDLLRLYAAELVEEHDSAAERAAATHRMLDYYVHSALIADRALYPARDRVAVDPPSAGVTVEPAVEHDRALDWFAVEHLTLTAAMDLARRDRFHAHTWSLAWAMANFLERRGHWQEWIGTQASALDAARRLRDRRRQAIASRLLARGHTRLSQYGAATRRLRRAIALTESLGDRIEHAHALINLAQVYERRGRFAEALSHAEQALALYEAADHTLGRGNALNSIGWYHATLGDHLAAIASCERALALHELTGHRHGQSSALDSLGYAYHLLGRHDEAVTFYRRSADLQQKLGDRYGEAGTLVRLGETHDAAGDPAAARVVWERALAIFDQLGHPDADQLRARCQHLDTQEGSTGSLPPQHS